MGKAKRIKQFIKDILISCMSWSLSFFVKRDETKIAFGSWCGELYNDNSKYFAEYIMRTHPEYSVYWVGNKTIREELPKECTFVELDSVSSVFSLLKCKYFFFTQMHRPDICRYNVYRGATLCLLDHGNALKKWGLDAVDYNGSLEYKNFSLAKKVYTNVVGENYPYRYMVVSSEKTGNAYRTALAYRMDADTEILQTGLPRNDIFVNHSSGRLDYLKEKYAALLGFSVNKRIVLYLPTYRRKKERVESFVNLEDEKKDKLNKLLQMTNAVLLEKNHFAADKYLVNRNGEACDNIIKVQVPVDVQELLEIADVLISDYSGCILDYVIMERPVILYVYDYDEYRTTDSGLYYDIDEYAAGFVANSFEDVYSELYRLMKENRDEYNEQRKNVRRELATFEDGHASEKLFQAIFSKKTTEERLAAGCGEAQG